MSHKIVIIGAGFAGVWSALSAKRLINIHGKGEDIQVTVIAPDPNLVVRPRLYEADPSAMCAPLGQLFESAGIEFIAGYVDQIDAAAHMVHFTSTSSEKSSASYDRLILAAGSTVVKPASIPGLQEHAFDIDTLSAAAKLDAHLQNLVSGSNNNHQDTIVVCGAGFTGIEIVTELPKRFSGTTYKPHLVLVDSADTLASTLGPGPRPVIAQAIKDLNIEVKLGSRVSSVNANGITLASGESIESKTVIWTAGVKATPLTTQISNKTDQLNRLHVDRYLRVSTEPHILATGDAAAAAADVNGHNAMMSCQHAIPLGRYSGHNAAADLLGLPLMEYTQPDYGTCLDLGAYGTVVTRGWEREVELTGPKAKKVKQYINQKLIYPPQDSGEALALADPLTDASFEGLLEMILRNAG
ncbi:unnamed protein product [Periconia digitata]|uniref:FAD/NAD(P)-binding domain-containing protein n=1 Tax=Periconia digitata TaxID=1303443 RepID=A0A9W4UG52_9PLEO|nr:unnamed protein product [Periconia digitata]